MIGIGHRVVHGGMQYAAPVRLDRDDAGIAVGADTTGALAPAAQPGADPDHPRCGAAYPTGCLLRYSVSSRPGARRAVLCAASTSHRRRRPALWLPWAVVRISCLGNCAPRWPELASGRVIIAHLGNGASLCAVKAGRSVASTMGFTAVDGLMMGTRCGALDPGVLLYLMQEHRMDAAAIEDLIYRKSGLLGVSGISSDMRTLRASSDPRRARGDCALRLSYCPRNRVADRGLGWARWHRVLGGHWRKRCCDARRGGRWLRLGRCHSRRREERERRRQDQCRCLADSGTGHPDR